MPRKKPTHVDHPVAAGRRLREARERAGLSQRELAFPGCSPAYLSRIEAGARVASPSILRELARRLGVAEEYLARGRGGGHHSALDEANVVLKLGEIDEAGRLFGSALEDASSEEERSHALEGLARIALQRDELERAVELFEEALALAVSDLDGRPDLAEGLARVYALLGRTARALSILERCLKSYAEEPMQHVRFAGLLGVALTDNGNFDEAERILAEALARGRELAEPHARARAYWWASRIERERGESELATRFAMRTNQILQAAEDTHAIARVIRTLAQVHLERGRPRDALALLREGSALVEASGTEAEIAESRIERARALAALGRREEAAALANEVITMLEEADGIEFACVYAALGDLLSDLGDTKRAREFLEVAIAQLEGRGWGRRLVCAYKRLAELLIREGDPEEALVVLERSLEVHGRAPTFVRPVLKRAERG